jgi:osmotically-inducible protein OsmY
MKIKYSLAMLLAMTALAACEPTAVAVGAASGSTIAGDNRTLQTIADDQSAAYLANRRLTADTELTKNARAVASVYHGTLLLTGEAPTEALRARAEQRVQNLKHVRRVYNQITIGSPIGMLKQSDDALVTSNVKARMLATTNLKSAQFKVITEDGTVYLMGWTSPEQANIAADVVHNSSGVKRVVKVVEYKS